MLWVALQFPALAAGTLENLAAWACQFTPRVSLEPPQGLLAEVQGSLRYFSGIKALVRELRAGLQAMGIDAQLGLGRTPRAALWRARSGQARLAAVPLSVMDADAEFFRNIGVATLGELWRLPRDGLARRCNERVLQDLDRALGTLPEPRDFFTPPPRFSATLELPAEVTHAEGVLFAARRLLLQLEGLLAARHAGIRRFGVALLHRQGKPTIVEVGLASPGRDAGRLAQLLRERLARVPLLQPVEALRLEAGDFAPLQQRSAGMFGDAAADEEGWAQLIERLRARLGRDAVHGLALYPEHRPEHAWQKVEPGEWEPREVPRVGARPAWLIEPARRVGEAQFELLAGPERIESGWWDGDDAKRDYFIAQAVDGAMVWVYREAGEWFLHGLFA
ncbi:MAG TPA: DNA polymerase Y family protein [Burkholderiales bacterium]|jgi:protein ImuB|nr:DNA polymerase Y family protein [Burkholderiales bacterium]